MIDPVLLEAAERVFADVCTFDAVETAETEGFSPQIWDAVAAMGLPWISVPERAGGVGGSLEEAVAVLRIAGRFAAPIPLAETGVMGGWLLSSAGLELGEGPLSVVPGRPGDTLRLDGGLVHGHATRVPWAAAASKIVALADGHVVVMDPADVQIDTDRNLAGEPRDTIRLDGVAPSKVAPAPEGVDASALRIRGALCRAALIAGALEGIVDLTVGYTRERRQFGKAVGSFQSVQNLLVRCGEDAVLVGLAVEAAARELDRGHGDFEVACAKSLASDAARTTSRAAHQAHGAMGMTREYPLHQLTRRLWSWRAEFGDATWRRELGDGLVTLGPDRLYRAISEGSGSGIAL
jgi:acyl-CoA dehydrogenase